MGHLRRAGVGVIGDRWAAYDEAVAETDAAVEALFGVGDDA